VRNGAVGDATADEGEARVARSLTQDVPQIYPRPLPQPTWVALARRSSTIARVISRRFAPVALRQVRTIRQGALPGVQLARPLRKSFEDLGGTFMKFGQIIASSPGMFGDDVAEEFRACLDTGPAVPFPEVRQRVEEDLGRPLDVVFAEFESPP
jgi:predicted unusual protein kinase regulating ubiquinone biosynthesis (AarF/ABC1/UbiB family)